jgi:hypothetical protein
LKLLIDEMYPPTLAGALRSSGVEASTVADSGLAGCADLDILVFAAVEGYVVLTENVADFARLASERVTAGMHHAGVLIALSSRFSRHPSGIPQLVKAICSLTEVQLEDRLMYLEQPRD